MIYRTMRLHLTAACLLRSAVSEELYIMSALHLLFRRR